MKKAAIVTCFFGWYKQRLYYLYKRLKENDYDIKCYTSDYQHIEKKRLEMSDDRVTYIHVPEYKKNISIQRIRSHFTFAKKCQTYLKREELDLLYVVAPPNMVANIAANYKRNHPNTKLVVDIIDLWPESFPSAFINKTPLFSIWKNMRDKALEVADRIVIECDFYRDNIESKYLDKCSTLRLHKDYLFLNIEDIRNEIQSSKDDFKSKGITLCYLGSINNIVDLNSISEVLLALRDNEYLIDFHFIGKGSAKQKLLDIVQEAGGTIHDHGAIFDEEKKREIMKKCDFGINIMKSSVKVGLTIKSIDYLSSALPLLNNIKGDTWSFVDQYHVGINYKGDPSKFIQEIEKCGLHEMKSNALTCYQNLFSTESFEKTFDDIIDEIKI